MFKFLKEKLKGAISKISEGVEKEGKVEEKLLEKPAEEKKEEKGFFAKIKEKFVQKEEAKPLQEAKKIEKPIPVGEKPREKFEKKEEPAEKVQTEAKKEPETELPSFEEKRIHEIKPAAKDKVTAKPEPIIEGKKHFELKRPEIKEIKKEIPKSVINPAEEIKKEAPKAEEKIDTTIIKKVIEKHPKDYGKDFPEMLKKADKAFSDKKVEEEAQAKFEKHYDEIRKEEEPEIKEPEKKGFFAKLTEKIITTKITGEQFEKFFWEMELALMENNVAVEVIDKIKSDMKNELVEKPIRRNKIEETIEDTLKNSINELFEKTDFELISSIKSKKEKPYVIAFFGINGSGKTTSIAKLAKMLKDSKISCVLAASDTFRAASIEQLSQHAERIGIKMIRHDYGSDPAAVAFDAIKHAQAKNIDVVLIDTAGRMHSNANLIEEMKKIIRVAKPDLKIFVGESITGNDCVEQAKSFNDAVGIDGIILAKADIDEKGGAAISVSYVTKKPILYIGTGQEYSDLERFDEGKIMANLGLT